MVHPDVPVRNFKRLINPIKIQIAKSNMVLLAHGKGIFERKITLDNVCRSFDIEVLIVEKLSHNLLFLSKLTKRDLKITFDKQHCSISKDGIDLARGKISIRDLYGL
jgi:hypothetical protein